MSFNDQLSQLYTQMGDRVAGFSESTLLHITDPAILSASALFGALVLGALLWNTRDENAAVGVITTRILAVALGAMIGIMIMALGFIMVYAGTNAATHAQDAHRLQRPATQEALTELNDAATEAARQRYDVERVSTDADDWTRMARAHHDNDHAELTTEVEVTVDAERDARWMLHYDPVTGDVSMSDAGDARDAKRVTPHDVAK